MGWSASGNYCDKLATAPGFVGQAAGGEQRLNHAIMRALEPEDGGAVALCGRATSLDDDAWQHGVQAGRACAAA
jgi:hypothetical protein